jgi:Fe-S-cluster containining protein
MSDELCTSCALCCDGTLFGSVKIEPEERPHVRLPILDADREARRVMLQPCVALEGRRCSVYEERPQSCARYECELRKGLAAGAVSIEEARAKVDRMHARLDVARAAFAAGSQASIWQIIDALDRPKSAAEEDAWARAHAEGIAAIGEVIGIAREVFEPGFAGAGKR